MARKSGKKVVSSSTKIKAISVTPTAKAGKIINQTSNVKALAFTKEQEQKLFKILAR